MILEQPKTCLIVDDTRSMRVMINSWMNHAGLTSIIAENGKVARAAIEKHCPDVLITDIEMPMCNGLELVCWVRRHPVSKISTLPIVVITSLDDPELEQIILEIGTSFLLRKPLSEEAVRRTVRAAMDSCQTPLDALLKNPRLSGSSETWSLVRQMANDALLNHFRNGTS